MPTSYMCVGSHADFFGGYDHKAEAGIVHVADHRIAPGKKQWSWGNHEFGYAWDRHLTEPDANGVYRPYIELMAGVYTDNQPDFSFLTPGETRVFNQYWYPIRDIGRVHLANEDVAVSLGLRTSEGSATDTAQVGVAATSRFCNARIRLSCEQQELASWTSELAPDQPFVAEVSLPAGCVRQDLSLYVDASDGRELIAYHPIAPDTVSIPESATEPPAPSAIPSNDELFVTGMHIDQYRHATRQPDAYWHEALDRDPLDARCNNALGFWLMRRGEFTAAETHFRRALQRATLRNPNPSDGGAFYNLGVCLRYLARDDEAYDAFYKATWNAAWRAAAFLAIAEIDACRSNWVQVLKHVQQSLCHDTDNLRALNLKVIALQRMGRTVEAAAFLAETRALDPLDVGARWLDGKPIDCDTQTRIDLAGYLARAGQFDDAMGVLKDSICSADAGTGPLLYYYLAAYAEQSGSALQASEYRRLAAGQGRDYCFPARLEELLILEDALRHVPGDAAAHYYLGNLLYDKRRHHEAIAHWEASVALDPYFPTAWRNLGIGRFNVLGDALAARNAYERAWSLDPSDARLLYERDQLWKRIGVAPGERLAELERNLALVQSRDDLSIELCALYNHTDQADRALKLVLERRFQPWEGGEGQVLGQYVRTRLALGKRAMDQGRAADAIEQFTAALAVPESLGEARHLLANPSDIFYWIGRAYQAIGEDDKARAAWESAAEFRGDFQLMSVRPYSEMSCFSALALRELGRSAESDALLNAIYDYADALEGRTASIDYFATSLPTMLLFEDDLQKRQTVQARLMKCQAKFGLRAIEDAQGLLAQVLGDDPNNAAAIDLAKEIERKKH